MKKNLLFSFVLAAFTIVSSFAQDISVPETQNLLITKRTADWCTFCGLWGWDLFHGILEDDLTNALAVAAHYSGGLKSDAAEAISDNFGAFGQPVFFLGNENQRASRSNIDQVRTAIKNQVTNAQSTTPLAQTGIEAVYNDTHLVVNTKSTFFKEGSGDYFLGIYAVEKKVVHFQESVGDNAEHINVLKESLSGTEFGDMVATGSSITPNTSFTWTAATPLADLPNLDNLMIATIIWRKDNDVYNFVNLNFTDTFTEETTTTSTLTDDLLTSFKAFPTVWGQGNLQVEIELPTSVANVDISLVNAAGQPIQRIATGPMAVGVHQYTVARPGTLASGMYLIQLSMPTGVVSRQIFVH